MLDPTVGYLIDLGGAVLLAGAALHKFRRLDEFAASFAAYRVMSASWAGRSAWAVPVAELAIAAGLAAAGLHRTASLAAAALLGAYAGAIALNLARGRRELDCGCAPAGRRRPIGAWMIWRNLALAALLVLSSMPWSPRALQPVDALTLAGGLAAAAFLYLALDALAGEIAPKGAAMKGAP